MCLPLHRCALISIMNSSPFLFLLPCAADTRLLSLWLPILIAAVVVLFVILLILAIVFYRSHEGDSNPCEGYVGQGSAHKLCS